MRKPRSWRKAATLEIKENKPSKKRGPVKDGETPDSVISSGQNQGGRGGEIELWGYECTGIPLWRHLAQIFHRGITLSGIFRQFSRNLELSPAVVVAVCDFHGTVQLCLIRSLIVTAQELLSINSNLAPQKLSLWALFFCSSGPYSLPKKIPG